MEQGLDELEVEGVARFEVGVVALDLLEEAEGSGGADFLAEVGFDVEGRFKRAERSPARPGGVGR